ncbi:MAG: hypothetical protein KDC38_03420 [Planctomycetes bacterium]|nr:hypothetical protein [Planctomycetota bacterium]
MADPSLSAEFLHDHYLIRRKVLTVLGAKFHVYDPNENVVLFSQQKAFKLKEDIRVYASEAMTDERLSIQARQVIDFSAAYDVVDSHEGRKVGALRRKGFKSLLRDSWEFLDPDDRPIGKLEEDSTMLAVVRRLLTNLIPQTYHLRQGHTELAQYRQFFNPFVLKYRLEIEPDARELIDPRLLIAGGILLAAIEGRQEG